MKKLTFKDTLRKKIDESFNRATKAESQRDRYYKQLKATILEDVKERVLREVPKYLYTKELKLSGPTYYIKTKEEKFMINTYEEFPVYFDTIDEIRSFLDEIVKEFGGSLCYEIHQYSFDVIEYKASITFEYNYKES